ncbi:MAG: glycogen synthase GlgA [Pseudomonadota bacterium]
MRVLFVASECVPLIKTGGLADVVGALPKALADLGMDVRVLLPGYPAVLDGLRRSKFVGDRADLFGVKAQVVSGRTAEGLEVLAIDAPGLFDRPGNPYLDEAGEDHADNWQRFGALSWLGASMARRGIDGWQPDVVHAHDWQAGLVPVYLGTADQAPPTLFTIHNMAFQGLFPATCRSGLGLPESGFDADGYEYWGQVGFLKAGLFYADHLTTVSPTYARELLEDDFGMGLEGVLRARQESLSGIVNGIDTDVWDPESDPLIAKRYSRRAPAGKRHCKAALVEEFGLEASDGPLFAVISRLTLQKGLDLLLELVPHIVARGGRLAVVGSGDAELEAGFRAAAEAHPGAVGVFIGYDEALAHRIQAGADAIVVPSRFEPCGLTQLCGLRYGTLPIVSRTGGLADTVIDANPAALASGCATGFQFAPVDRNGLRTALDRAFDAHAEGATWRRMVRNALGQAVGWEASAAAYAALYRDLVTDRIAP